MSCEVGASNASSSTNSPCSQAHVEQRIQLRPRQHAQNQQHAARAGGPRLEHLVGIHEEILAHRRHAQRRELRGRAAQMRQ